MATFPVSEVTHKGSNGTIVCFAYDEDLYQMYDFYTARYKEISFDEFMKLGYEYFSIKLRSIPESEPLHAIIKSRTININEIKDKEERKYWRKLKKANAIPDIYISNEEIENTLKERVGKYGNNIKRF